MSILTWIVLGLIAGWLASMITNSGTGLLTDIILGIVGAFVGGFLMNLFGQSGAGGLDIYSVIVATLGAVVVIWLGRMFKTREV